MTDLAKILINFYKNDRMPLHLNDNGGPFGFDIHHALEVDYLIHAYGCDGIIETGTFYGDTTLYLAEMYSDLPIISCELNSIFYKNAKERLASSTKHNNLTLYNESSEKVLRKVLENFKFPFIYLDAHFLSEDPFPIFKELNEIKRGVVCIGDFFIGTAALMHHQMFGDDKPFKMVYSFDVLDGVTIDENFVLQNINPSTPVYVNNAANLGVYPLPCHQYTRRAGRGYFAVNNDQDLFSSCQLFAIPSYPDSYILNY